MLEERIKERPERRKEGRCKGRWEGMCHKAHGYSGCKFKPDPRAKMSERSPLCFLLSRDVRRTSPLQWMAHFTAITVDRKQGHEMSLESHGSSPVVL